MNNVALITDVLQVDLISAVFFLWINRANVQGLLADPERGARFAALGEVPPDGDREAVSVYALARGLRIPYETARRHVAKLVQKGLCEKAPEGGVIVPARILVSATSMSATDRSVVQALAFVEAMGRCGARARTRARGDGDRRNLVARHCTDYFLNTLALVDRAFDFDLVAGLVFLAIVRANTWHITTDAELSEAYAEIGMSPPDDLRRPVSIYALARVLSLPYETTRRYVLALVAADLCERGAGGLVVPARVFTRSDMIAAAQANWNETLRFLAALGQIGVGASDA